MARPRVFDPGARSSINIYLHPDQLSYFKKWAIETKRSPSKIVRTMIDLARQAREGDTID